MAADLGYGIYFPDDPGYSLTDDHVPFKNLGIPAVDIIDFDYDEHHTTNDDLDHISYESIGIVADVVLQWLLGVVNTNITTMDVLPFSSSLSTSDEAPFQGFSMVALIILFRRFQS